jgi:hypothetical protein
MDIIDYAAEEIIINIKATFICAKKLNLLIEKQETDKEQYFRNSHDL